jgi:hypothetical protein
MVWSLSLSGPPICHLPQTFFPFYVTLVWNLESLQQRDIPTPLWASVGPWLTYKLTDHEHQECKCLQVKYGDRAAAALQGLSLALLVHEQVSN